MGVRRNYRAATPHGKSDVRARGDYERAKAACLSRWFTVIPLQGPRRRSNYGRDNVLRTLGYNS